MVKATFEHELDDSGLLSVTTHFGQIVSIACHKQAGEVFRLGGTAGNTVMTYEGLILKLSKPTVSFRAFYNPENSFDGIATLSNEKWDDSDLHCYVTEYYPLDMEGKPHEWFVSKKLITYAHYLFINLDVLDGGGNLIKRYRVSPFTGQHRVMEMING